MQDRFISTIGEGQRDPLLATLRESHQYNVVIHSVDGRELIDSKGKKLLDFASCNYIGFDQDQEALLAEGVKAAREFGIHTSRARLMGYHTLFSNLEEKLAHFMGGEEALLFPNTTLASIGIIPALMRHGDLIILDKAAHATMYQASQVARDKGALLKSYENEDFDSLKNILEEHRSAPRKMVCVDGVYSMTGDYANLPKLLPIIRKHNALLYIDDAHGFGFIGENPTPQMPYGFRGNGVINHYGCQKDDPILYVAGTAKGLAAASAFALVTPKMKEFLMAYAKPLDYTHPSTPFALGILNAALDLLPKVGEERRLKVFQMTHTLVEGLRQMGFYVMTKTLFPIISVWVGETDRLLEASRKLYNKGIFLTSCPYPTMPRGKEALRLTITSSNKPEHIDALLDAFQSIALDWRSIGAPFHPMDLEGS
ncbi:aminotransferase class I/II-fold pyridoxal phosphate-dependent enzyme [Candidatus Neptunochlamydia vexilliferae]|nr:pyridoxal phosphate-dependent aminotransferase family protein [Candidatus Neptunochlamydia vexilliferae]